ncbi:MAG: extracellular solute-binding protein, partial [Elusimicrobiaceae bacterium]|nr:extracellular solute-binding protein [Elusimicrobiaceae bacterium]
MIFWMLPDSGIETSEVMEGFLKNFRQQNPDINLDVQVINRRALWNKIFTLKHDIGKEGCPDLIAFPHYWTSILATAKLLEPLQNFDKNISITPVLDPLRPHCFLGDGEEIFSFPWWLDITALHYREDHIKAVTNKPEEALSTWQGLLDIC